MPNNDREYSSSTHGSGPASPSPSPTPDDSMVTETVGSKDGFYLLRKDSERRSTLVKVLGEDQEQIADKWLSLLHRDVNNQHHKVTKEHLLKMLFGLKEFIRDGNNRKTVQYAIDSLREEMDFDMSAIYELQLAIYVFQEAVGEILRQRHIQPHWMFALDNLLRSAVQCAITVISPELGAIIGDKTDLPPVHITEDEDSVSGPSTADSVPRPTVPVMAPVQRLDSTANRTLYAQLKDLEDENRRLLLKLIDSQKVYQDVLRNAVQQRQQDTDLLRASMSHPLHGHASCQLALNDMPLQNDTNGVENNESDSELVKWLTTLECDQDTINRLLAERFSKRQLLNSVTREDLRRANLKGGMFCRIWEVIQKHRQRPAHSPDPDV